MVQQKNSTHSFNLQFRKRIESIFLASLWRWSLRLPYRVESAAYWISELTHLRNNDWRNSLKILLLTTKPVICAGVKSELIRRGTLKQIVPVQVHATFQETRPSALIRNPDGIPTTNSESVAKGFRDHFLSVYAETLNATHPALPSCHYDTALCRVTFDITDVEKLPKRINPYSAMGPDDIHPRILKEAADVLALPLFSLFTDSLLTGVLPAALKQAHVTPIYKSDDRY